MKLILNLSVLMITGSFAVSALAAEHTVVMKSISYEPKVVVVKAGDMVEWTNASMTPHSATSDDQTANELKFDTGMIDPKKKSKAVAFKTAGTYSYHCTIHGKTMSGKVEVQ